MRARSLRESVPAGTRCEVKNRFRVLGLGILICLTWGASQSEELGAPGRGGWKAQGDGRSLRRGEHDECPR